MPILMRPGNEFKIFLPDDLAHYPEQACPCFIARAMSLESWRQIADISERIESQAGGSVAGMDMALDAIAACLVGWSGMTDPASGESLPYSRANLARVLTLQEMGVLLALILNQGIGAAELKNFESPQASGSAESAADAKE